ncbi:MAG: type II secretion system F family protein [Dehalococcoidia bacterium]|nr:MAG: type II secretion system F family protein [Dehalococcoidia bacterium]
MVYQYVAYNEKGVVVKGKLPAADEEAATDLLGYAGYQAISLKPYVPFLNTEKLSASFLRVKPTEIVLMYRQMAMLLESGIDIVSSLELLQEQSVNRALKKVLGEIIADLRGGNQLSRALGKHPQVFSPIYCRLLSVGEQTGDLETVLKQVADYMEKEITTAKETKSALMYPAITFVVTIVVIAVLVTFVLPSFGSLYSSLGAELPTSAQILIDLANKIQSYWMYLMLAVFAIAGLAYIYIKTPGGRYKWDKLVLRLPIVGRVSHLSELARCCRSMSLLIHAGLPLTEAMPLLIQGSNNRVLTKALINVQQDMIQGEGLSRPMAKNKLFLPMMVQMVRVGEETGNLDVTLLSVARSYEAEAEDKTRSLIALIPPTMTLIIGAVIGLIALSLVSAMYSMYGQGF